MINAEALDAPFVVFWVNILESDKWRSFFVGYDRPGELLLFRQMRSYREYSPKATYSLHILSGHLTDDDAKIAVQSTIETCKPWLNIHSTAGVIQIGRQKGQVECITTGQIFDNASKAAEWIGASASQMSNHLIGKKYCNSVRGMRFRRI